jgi:organic hydroperoxide reductase OsmC/OhrA
LLVAALAQCHMLWFLHLCAVNGIVVISYTHDAQGMMAEGGDGGGQFTTVTFAPELPSPIQARRRAVSAITSAAVRAACLPLFHLAVLRQQGSRIPQL